VRTALEMQSRLRKNFWRIPRMADDDDFDFDDEIDDDDDETEEEED
jgi:hypothetical protein